MREEALELMNMVSPHEVSKRLGIPVRTLYDWKKKAQIVKEQISTEIVMSSTTRSLDIVDEAIQLARKAGKLNGGSMMKTLNVMRGHSSQNQERHCSDGDRY